MRRIVYSIRSGKLCRDCLNQRYGLSLRRECCEYWQYPGKCSSCGAVRNIVADVPWRHRWRLWRVR